MTPEVRKYLDEVKAALAITAPDAELILFGSQARGDARPDSDIDLLVLVDREELSYDDKGVIYESIYDVELKYTIDIQAVIRTRKQWFERPFRTPFFMNVMHDGVRI